MIKMIENNVSDYFSVAPSLNGAVIPEFTVGPFDLSQIPEISFSPFNWLMLIPVLTFVVMIVSQKIMQKFTYQSPETKDAQNNMSMKIMTWTMPLLSVYIEFQMAAAIGVYWIFRNIIQVVQKAIIAKLFPVPKFTEEDYKKAEQELGMSGKQKKKAAKASGDKKYVRSLHHIDDEEWLAAHPAPAEEEDDSSDTPVGDTTGVKSKDDSLPPPIKNDEKSAYKEKKKK